MYNEKRIKKEFPFPNMEIFGIVDSYKNNPYKFPCEVFTYIFLDYEEDQPMFRYFSVFARPDITTYDGSNFLDSPYERKAL
jgi:hypothetical protein